MSYDHAKVVALVEDLRRGWRRGEIVQFWNAVVHRWLVRHGGQEAAENQAERYKRQVQAWDRLTQWERQRVLFELAEDMHRIATEVAKAACLEARGDGTP